MTGVSYQATMAQAAAKDAERALRTHIGGCVPCGSSRGQQAKMCTTGRNLTTSAAAAKREAALQRQLDRAPAPGQGTLPIFIR